MRFWNDGPIYLNMVCTYPVRAYTRGKITGRGLYNLRGTYV